MDKFCPFRKVLPKKETPCDLEKCALGKSGECALNVIADSILCIWRNVGNDDEPRSCCTVGVIEEEKKELKPKNSPEKDKKVKGHGI
jgi:hypothetical protein